MKRLASFALVISLAWPGLTWPGLAMAQDLSGTWRWIRVQPLLGKWFQQEGNADVEYSNGKFQAHLYCGDDGKDVCYQLSGTFSLGKPKTDKDGSILTSGQVTAKTTTVASDAAPIVIHGSYHGILPGPTWQPSMGRTVEEIELNDGEVFIGLHRVIR
jgi:hypothetical protein